MNRYIRNMKIIYWKTRQAICNEQCVTCPAYKECMYYTSQEVIITNEDEGKIINIAKKLIKKLVILLEKMLN